MLYGRIHTSPYATFAEALNKKGELESACVFREGDHLEKAIQWLKALGIVSIESYRLERGRYRD